MAWSKKQKIIILWKIEFLVKQNITFEKSLSRLLIGRLHPPSRNVETNLYKLDKFLWNALNRTSHNSPHHPLQLHTLIKHSLTSQVSRVTSSSSSCRIRFCNSLWILFSIDKLHDSSSKSKLCSIEALIWNWRSHVDYH